MEREAVDVEGRIGTGDASESTTLRRGDEGADRAESPTRAGSPPGPDALIAFLVTAVVGLLGLLVAIRFQPGWFGLSGAGARGDGATPTVLLPRPTMPTDPEADFLPRPVVERAAAAPTLAQTIFSDALPSVVHVTTRSRQDVVIVTQEFISGTGSGIVWDQRGHIVTCLHVVADASSAFVTLSDGSEWEAKLVGLDEATDLAVVRIDAPPDKLTPVRVGSSADLRVGGRVFSVACPYGLGHSLSVGYVSGIDRKIRSPSGRYLEGTLQTDASLHPGSSGGALIDDQGRVIGLNAAIHADSRRQVGVGFAIPIDRLQEAVPSIITNGFRWVSRFGFVTASDQYSAEFLRRLASTGVSPPAGVIVAEVTEDGPAALAGLRSMQQIRSAEGMDSLVVRDVIVGAQGRPVTCRADLDTALASLGPEEPLVLRVARPDGEEDVVLEPPGGVLIPPGG